MFPQLVKGDGRSGGVRFCFEIGGRATISAISTVLCDPVRRIANQCPFAKLSSSLRYQYSLAS